jgi:hypothetical protein
LPISQAKLPVEMPSLVFCRVGKPAIAASAKGGGLESGAPSAHRNSTPNIRRGRHHIRNGIGTVKTEKTGTVVTLPILPVLSKTLEARTLW